MSTFKGTVDVSEKLLELAGSNPSHFRARMLEHSSPCRFRLLKKLVHIRYKAVPSGQINKVTRTMVVVMVVGIQQKPNWSIFISVTIPFIPKIRHPS